MNDVVQREKRKKEMRAILGFDLKQWVSKRKCWARDRESLCSSSRVCVISMLDSALTSWGIPHSSFALVLSLSSYAVQHPSTPGRWFSSCFWLPVLSLCFTRVRRTARVHNRGLVIVPSLLAKRWRPYLDSSSFEGVKEFLVFLFFVIVGNVRIGVKGRE
jgi:hypothetical protein